MPLSFAAILPHGSEIVSQLTDDPKLMEKTRVAMREAGRRFAEASIDTVIVLDPHAEFMVQGAITLGATFHAAGIVGDPDDAHIKTTFETDVLLVEEIIKASDGKLPLVRAVGSEKGRDAVLPLSWGALIPLWFTAHPLMDPRPKVIVVAPERRIEREKLIAFGQLLGEIARKSERRIALIASGDLGHGHDESGPYGFSFASAEHDLHFCEALVDGDLSGILGFTDDFLEDALVDAFWQVLVLHGALESEKEAQPELLSYEAPTYFGMAVAVWAL
jgi:aromatic ring-opening dioxygenase LigB subunit